MINKISIIGGDLRIVKLAEMLIEEGVEVFSYGLEKADIVDLIKCKDIEETIKRANIVLGPIPFSSNGKTINTPFSDKKVNVEQLLDSLTGKTLIAGAIKQDIYDICLEKNIKVIDILKREELAVLNTIATSEGTIQIAIENTNKLPYYELKKLIESGKQ